MTSTSEVLRREELSDVEVKQRLARCYDLLLSFSRPKGRGGCDTLDGNVHAEGSEAHPQEPDVPAEEQHR